jgi:metal-responsive CopG/Arc/MetJ family transcriptional regulator
MASRKRIFRVGASIRICLPKDLRSELEEWARAEGVTISEFVRSAVKFHIALRKKEAEKDGAP